MSVIRGEQAGLVIIRDRGRLGELGMVFDEHSLFVHRFQSSRLRNSDPSALHLADQLVETEFLNRLSLVYSVLYETGVENELDRILKKNETCRGDVTVPNEAILTGGVKQRPCR